MDDLKISGCDLSHMTITILKDTKGTMKGYPVNQLRNLALEGIEMMHAAYIDSNFMIYCGLHDSLIQKAVAPVLANTGVEDSN
jgi:hypothetical protein